MTEAQATMTLLKDKRRITAVWSEPPHEIGATIGCHGVTKIEVYEEPAVGTFVPWFAVWEGDVIVARYNGSKMAEVRYE